mgnify:CR=1 FL=1
MLPLRPLFRKADLSAERTFLLLAVQLAAGKQRGIQRFVVAFEVSAMPLSPDTNVYLRFLRQFQTGQIIVPLQLIPKSVLLVVDVLVHFVILQL